MIGLATLSLLTVLAGKSDVEMKLIPTGATQKTGGYRPIRAILGTETSIKVKPAGLTNPMFSAIKLGDKSISIILDEPEGKPAKLYIDSNGDGDLTNDPAAVWEPKKQGTSTMYFGSGTADIGKGTPVGINFYRFDPKDPQRAQLKDTVLYYFDFGYEVTLKLDGKSFTSFIAGEPSADSSLSIDRNRDGQISYKKESIKVGVPFNFTGTTYELTAKNGLSLEKAKEKLPLAPLPPDVSIGKKALKFEAATLDGSKVKFPSDYKGKIVLLDFWATWCGPCIAELPNVKAAYEKWHGSGFEILSVSFDQKDKETQVKDFAAKNGMSWRHIYEGKYWDTTLGDLYDVSGIPFELLVDGNTGEILGDASTLRGPGLTDLIGKMLSQKKARK